VIAQVAIVLLVFAWLVMASGGPPDVAAALSAQATEPASASTPAPTSIPLKLLKLSPEKGPMETAFTIAGEGLPASTDVEFVWMTVDGSYVTKVSTENVEFQDRSFVEKAVSMGHATTDAQGQVSQSFTAPEDYGEIHDIYALVGGQQLAKGGFRLMRTVTINPQEGPLGTLITIKVSGLGSRQYENTMAVRYDNMPTGIITAVTTKGTAVVQIRAAGSAGKHFIDFGHGARGAPFLNNQQSGTAHIPDSRFEFTITQDTNLPSDTLDWPDEHQIAEASKAAPKTTSSDAAKSGALATLTSVSGPILSANSLQATNLTPNAQVELFWVTARGNRVSPSGWSLTETSLVSASSDAAGSVTIPFQVPDDLGGWHSVKLVQGDKVMAEAPYFIERSLVDVTPKQVKSGDVFTVHIKGVGWTELDNGVAITYDNVYIGFACGFNSNGDVTVNLMATGAPGIHLIDLYPMIYQGHGKPPWGYQEPFLAYKQDFPGLALGYKLPAFRLALEVK
jgi:hypothetical protein